VDSLVNLAEEVLLKTPPETRPQVFTRLLPSNDHWNHSLQAFMRIPPKLSSSLISPLGGTVYLVNRSAPEAGVDAEPRDSNNYTLAHRLALYVTRLLSQHSFTEIGKISHPRLFHNLPLVIQLIDDDLNQRDTTGILILDSSEVRDECAELVSCARRHINEWIHSAANPLAVRDSATVVPFWEHRMSELRTDAPKVYRIAEAFVKVVSEREAMGLFSTAEPSLMIAEQMPAATAPLVLPACLAAYKQTLIQSPSSTKLCNRLISDLTDLGNLPDYEGWETISPLQRIAVNDLLF
jgi:[phosphatase 2A protein]-leucine-carboxy methyltransferase